MAKLPGDEMTGYRCQIPHPQVAPGKQMPHGGDLQPVKCPSNNWGMMEHGVEKAITASEVKFPSSGTDNSLTAWGIAYGKGEHI